MVPVAVSIDKEIIIYYKSVNVGNATLVDKICFLGKRLHLYHKDRTAIPKTITVWESNSYHQVDGCACTCWIFAGTNVALLIDE